MDIVSNPNGTGTPNAQPATTKRFQCQECEQTFGRVEHLTRHARSHMKERFLKCSHCRKGFYRIDALRRHEQIHKEPKRSSLRKGARACLNCASARRKCTGDSPCSGCQKRSLNCRYPGSNQSTASFRPSPTSLNLVSLQEGSSTHSGIDQPTPNSNCYESPMSYSNASGSESQNQEQLMIDHVQTPERLTAAHHPNQYSPSQVNVGSGISLPNLLNSHEMEEPISEERRPSISRYQNLAQQSIEGQPELHSMRQVSVNPRNQEGFSPWFQNDFSINWLPDTWTPDFRIDGEVLGNFGNFENDISARYDHEPLQAQTQTHGEPTQTATHINKGPDMSSPGSYSTQSAGHYYVDGDGARLPRVRKAPHRYSESYPRSQALENRSPHPTFAFPDLDQFSTTRNALILDSERIPSSVYNEISQVFDLTCVSSNHYSKFQGVGLPSEKILSYFIYLFTQYFRPTLPFIHPATFDLSGTHWLLILAMAAIGSHYADFETAEPVILAMHEFTRRAVLTTLEFDNISKPEYLVLTQVKLLSCVGMMYCGDYRLKSIAKSYHNDLVAFCVTDWDMSDSQILQNPSSSEQASLNWRTWIQAETIRRTGYCIWLLDCMWSFHFQLRPVLRLDDANVPIPCQEVLWEAGSALDWQQLHACATPSTSLHATIQLAYIEKRLQSSTGEFSRILCIHALFRRTWEVENYFKQPLTLWTPTAEKQDIETIESSIPVWLPGVPTYSKWRNSACDCLDILHWHANSVIGAASGMEHPTVLHLHLARIILLTPIQQTLNLTNLLAKSNPSLADNSKVTSLRQHIRRWALEDQHKARLATIHAGVLFWHVRRYSSDAFYEPSSVLLATLCLWAYGIFAPHTSPRPRLNNDPANTSRNASQNDDDDDDADPEASSLFPTSIQLDRPADDELVQLFVKRGVTMRANITGVGNLCSPKGPLRILIEGRNLLSGLKMWGEGRGGVEKLSKLIEIEACRMED